MPDALNYAVYGVGAIGFMPLVATAIAAACRARRDSRRRAMLNRFADRAGNGYY